MVTIFKMSYFIFLIEKKKVVNKGIKKASWRQNLYDFYNIKPKSLSPTLENPIIYFLCEMHNGYSSCRQSWCFTKTIISSS